MYICMAQGFGSSRVLLCCLVRSLARSCIGQWRTAVTTTSSWGIAMVHLVILPRMLLWAILRLQLQDPRESELGRLWKLLVFFWCFISTAVGNIRFSGQLASEASAMPGSFVKGVARCSWRLLNPGDTSGLELIGSSIRGAVMYSVEEFFPFVADFPLASLGAVQGVTSIRLLEGVLTDMALEADRCCYSFLSRKGVTELFF